MQYTQYITIDGDRWDTIANKAYGNANNFFEIIAANPLQSIVDVFIGGITLLIPIIETTTDIDASMLPIWKQNQSTTTQEAIASAPLFVQIASNNNGSFDGSFD